MLGLQWLVTSLVIMSEVSSKPFNVAENRNDNSLILHGAMSGQLVDNGKLSEDTKEMMGDREKRQVYNSNETPEILVNETNSNETSFEDYEKEYLINMTLDLLRQFLYYNQYVKHLKEENSSISRTTSSHKHAVTADPVMSTALPHSGLTTTPYDRFETRILQQKALELNQMNRTQLQNVFNNLHHAAANGVEVPGITSLCCNIG